MTFSLAPSGRHESTADEAAGLSERLDSEIALVIEAAQAEPSYPMRSVRKEIYNDCVERVSSHLPPRTQAERTRIVGLAEYGHHLSKRHALSKRL